MSLLSSIEQAANAEIARAAKEEIIILTTALGTKDFTMCADAETGTVTIDNQFTFTMNGPSLAMMVVCPTCREEVPSRPIRTPLDFSTAIKGQAKAAKHDCTDTDS